MNVLGASFSVLFVHIHVLSRSQYNKKEKEVIFFSLRNKNTADIFLRESFILNVISNIYLDRSKIPFGHDPS